MIGMNFACPPPPFSVIGFGKVRQFKINREGFGNAIGIANLELVHDFLCPAHFLIKDMRAIAGIAPRLNQQAPQLLYRFEQRLPSLLDQNPPQQDAQRANVAPKGMLFGAVVGTGC